MKNLCGKTRKVSQPYEVWQGETADFGTITYLVLKKYQIPEAEANNPYARWFVAAKSAATFGGYDMGDNYVSEIKQIARRIWVDDGTTPMPTEIKELFAA